MIGRYRSFIKVSNVPKLHETSTLLMTSSLRNSFWNRFSIFNVAYQKSEYNLVRIAYYSSYFRNQSGNESPYDILGISKTASDKEIKSAYYQEAKKCHPDLNPNDSKAATKFKRLAAAYELLSDPIKRKKYDQDGAYNPYSSAANSNQQSSQQSYQYVYEG